MAEPKTKLMKTAHSSSRVRSPPMANNAEPIEYSRNSFDRFGDDLCELLLSYLPFKDKIILEDVCRQWKRIIYNKQSVLQVLSVQPMDHLGVQLQHIYNRQRHHINDLLVPIKVKNFVSGFANNMNMRTLDIDRLKTLLTKCRRIKRIEFTRVYVDSALLEVIGQYCPRLETIQLDIIGLEEEDIVAFGQKYGRQLKQIRFNNMGRFITRDYLNKFATDFGKKLLSYCQNIKAFVCEDITIINDKSPNFLPKLETIDLKLKRQDAPYFADFVDKYENKLRRMRLSTSEVEIQTLRNTLHQVSRFKQMMDLEINFQLMMHHFQGTPPNQMSISDKLTEMARSCPKLVRLILKINVFMTPNELITGNIWECFGKFHGLRKLDVCVPLLNNDESVEALKRLKSLTDLTIRCSRMGDPFFKDVAQFLPNLKSLYLQTDYDLSDNLMDSLSKLKFLRRLTLGNGHKALKCITDSGIATLIDNCDQLRKICFCSRPNITSQTIDKLIDFANKNSKYTIRFYSGFSRMGDEAMFAAIDLNSFTNIPQNLVITIRNGHANAQHQAHHFLHHPNVLLPPFPDLPVPHGHPNIHVLELNLAADNMFPPFPHPLPPPQPINGVDLQVLIHNHLPAALGNFLQPVLPNNPPPNE